MLLIYHRGPGWCGRTSCLFNQLVAGRFETADAHTHFSSLICSKGFERFLVSMVKARYNVACVLVFILAPARHLVGVLWEHAHASNSISQTDTIGGGKRQLVRELMSTWHMLCGHSHSLEDIHSALHILSAGSKWLINRILVYNSALNGVEQTQTRPFARVVLLQAFGTRSQYDWL